MNTRYQGRSRQLIQKLAIGIVTSALPGLAVGLQADLSETLEGGSSVPTEEFIRQIEGETSAHEGAQLRRRGIEYFRGTALAGVDELGRVLIALDEWPQDGRADHCFLYTSRERLAGPWSRVIEDARLHYRDSGLILESRGHAFALSLAMAESRPRPLNERRYAEVFVDREGVEWVRQDAPEGGGNILSDMTHFDLTTWPENFWYDLLDPESQSCPDFSDCINIGAGVVNPLGAVSCGIQHPGPCINDGSCGPITCAPQYGQFACCFCKPRGLIGSDPNCRCRGCRTEPTPCSGPDCNTN